MSCADADAPSATVIPRIAARRKIKFWTTPSLRFPLQAGGTEPRTHSVPLAERGEPKGGGQFVNFERAVIAPSEITTSWACRIPPLPALSPLVKGGEGRGEGGFESCASTNFGSAVGIIGLRGQPQQLSDESINLRNLTRQSLPHLLAQASDGLIQRLWGSGCHKLIRCLVASDAQPR